MKTYFECLPCIVNQALEGARQATDEETIQERIIRRLLRVASDADLAQPTPLLIGKLHRIIRELSGNPDPYRKLKDSFNEAALNIYPELREMVEASPNRLETALRLAIAGNIIDVVVNAQVNQSHVREAINHARSAPLPAAEMENFTRAVERARNILYLGDNAGEIVFDKLLVEQLPVERVTYVVKRFPVVNDATILDAEATGMTHLVEVIDSGVDTAGTVLSECSEEFIKRFVEADLVISKGQGNYEGLSNSRANIFFLFKAKCIVMTLELGYEIGRIVLRRSLER